MVYSVWFNDYMFHTLNRYHHGTEQYCGNFAHVTSRRWLKEYLAVAASKGIITTSLCVANTLSISCHKYD